MSQHCHSFMNHELGMALGVASRQSSAWFLLLAFASHKWVISGTLGLKWARSAVSVKNILFFVYTLFQYITGHKFSILIFLVYQLKFLISHNIELITTAWR